MRDGHYAIWGPVHAFPVPTSNTTVQTNIGTIVGLLTGTALMSGIDLVTFEAQNGIIPQCAMSVQRSQEVEIGDIDPRHLPAEPVRLHYYEHVANAVRRQGHVTCQSRARPSPTAPREAIAARSTTGWGTAGALTTPG